MFIYINTNGWWSKRYRLEVEASIQHYNALNQLQPVYTRPLDEKEKEQIFGGNPDYIKNIGRKIDGKEWKELICNEENGTS